MEDNPAEDVSVEVHAEICCTVFDMFELFSDRDIVKYGSLESLLFVVLSLVVTNMWRTWFPTT